MKKIKKIAVIFITMFILLTCCSCSIQSENNQSVQNAASIQGSSELVVRFIDVGQL